MKKMPQVLYRRPDWQPGDPWKQGSPCYTMHPRQPRDWYVDGVLVLADSPVFSPRAEDHAKPITTTEPGEKP